MDILYDALATIFQFYNVVAIIAGISLGIIVGAVPGLGPGMAMAIALPITFYMPPLVSLGFIVGIYKGGMYGGSITAILINVPGTSDAAATMLDGYPLAQKGKAGKALKMAIYASVTADILSDIVLIMVAGWLASYAIKLRSADIAAIMFFSLVIVGSVSGESLPKGLFSCMLGFLVAMVGIDPMMGVRRFTFGVLELDRGIDLIPFMVGIFGITEVLIQVEKKISDLNKEDLFRKSENIEDNRLSFKEYRRALPTIFQGTLIGTFIGALPGIGATTAAFLSYTAAKKFSRHSERFGKGELNGVAAAESGNNATCGATFIPLFTLGVPGSITAAMFMGALIIQGIQPGPFMFQHHATTIYALYVGMMFANVCNLLIGSLGIKIFARIALLPARIIYPIVVALCMAGVFSASGSLFDVGLMYIFGFVGFFMRKFDFPIAPMLISFILEPMFERSFRQALILSFGSYKTFFSEPVSLIFITLTLAIIAFEFVRVKRKGLRHKVVKD